MSLMRGLMMEMPLLISSLIRYAAQYHPEREIVTRTVEKDIHRTNYAEIYRRTQQLAHGLIALGAEPGDRIGTIGWNSHRHLEVYYATSSAGMILHTINPRLFADQLIYIMNHAEDRFLFVDSNFVPLLEGLAEKLPKVEGIVVMTAEDRMPETTLANVHCYETLIAGEPEHYDWPQFDENTASSLS